LGYVASGNFVLNKMFKCPTWDSRGSFPDTCINSGSSTAAPAYPYETLMWEPNVNITNVGAPFGSSTASPLKLTKLYQSSITWAICEYDLQLAQTSGHVDPTTKLWLYPVLPSHDKGRNVVYFDGHAETVPLNTLIADPIY
jgi:prepilin-type processing-associated H-X9-DG protein